MDERIAQVVKWLRDSEPDQYILELSEDAFEGVDRVAAQKLLADARAVLSGTHGAATDDQLAAQQVEIAMRICHASRQQRNYTAAVAALKLACQITGTIKA